MDYIDLKLYVSKLMKNWIIVMLCSIIGMAAAYIYSEFFATPVYASSVKIGVFYSGGGENITANDIETALKLIENCVVVLEDDVMAESIVDTVKQETGEEYTIAQIKSAFSFVRIGESQWLRVTAKTGDPELSALFCNVLAARASDIIVDNVANVQIRNLGEAKVSRSPVSPNTAKNTIVGFLIAFVGICLVIFLLVFFDNTVSSEEMLKEKFDLTVLGVVPHVTSHQKMKNHKPKKKPKLIM
jgi:capsular polysaccharide biosynthesis protein